MNTDNRVEDKEYHAFKKWWDDSEMIGNARVVFTHFEKYFKPEWQKQQPEPVNVGEEEGAMEVLNNVMSKYPHEATKGYRYLSDWIIEAMKAYKNQSLPAPVEGEGDSISKERLQKTFDNLLYYSYEVIDGPLRKNVINVNSLKNEFEVYGIKEKDHF